MAGDNRVGQQLAVNRDVAPELFQHGVGIGQIAAETADAPKALGNGEVGGQVGGFEGNRAVGGFEFEVGFGHISILGLRGCGGGFYGWPHVPGRSRRRRH